MRRFPRAKWVLPAVIDPPERLCFQIEVPNDRQHIAAFRGALLNLASAINWQDDPDHTAKEVARVWDEIYQNVERCLVIKTSPEFILENDMGDNIRLDPDNGCIIQIRCCGEWVKLIDVSTCVPGATVQPTNGEDLEPGQCREWDVSLRGNDRWLLPAAVSEGDTIEITGAQGAWSDGTPQWNCVNGKIFILGACTTDDASDTGDPLTSANHMTLIANIDGAWYEAYNTTLAVVPGVTDSQMFFQANDGSLQDNSGTTSFHVKLCKFLPVATPITITYANGSGPTSLDTSGGQTEWIFSVASAVEGGGYSIRLTFSADIMLTVQSAPSYAEACSTCTFAVLQLNGVTQQALAAPTYSSPTQFTMPALCDNIQVDTGSGDGTPVPFTMQLKVTLT